MSPSTHVPPGGGTPDPVLEDLLVAAMAAFDDGGNEAVEALLAQHPAHVTRLRRALADLRVADLFGDQRLAPDRLGDFQLGPRLGSGGMGVVYEAEQISLKRKVAVKVVRPELLFLDGARERFRREIDAVARLEHPAVVPILACGEVEGRPFYAMPWIAGCTADEAVRRLHGRDPADLTGADLRRAIAGDGPADDPDGTFAGRWWQACTRLLRQVALGIAHAHRRGILHRDLKPSNIMLTPDGRAQVLDFGLAHVRGDQRLTRTGSEPGTPAWMAPEQLRGTSADERTDVYGLAAVLHHLLTLEPPFPIDDSEVLRARILSGERRPLHERNRVVPRDLAIVLAAAMDVEPTRRHADAAAFADDLQCVLHSRPIQARRLPWRHRFTRWVRRHPAWATGVGAAIAFVALLPAGLWWQQRQANRELAAAKADVERSNTELAAAKHETERTNLELASAKDAAERGYNLTLEAIDSLLLRLADQRLRHTPGAQTLAAEVIENAMVFFDRLADENATERVHRMQLSVTKRLFELYLNLGKKDELPRLTARRMHLIDQHPEDDAAQLLRVDTWSMIADQEIERRQPKAVEQAIASARDLLQRSFDRPEHRHFAERCRAQLLATESRLAEMTGDRARMVGTLAQSVAIQRTLHAANPTPASTRTLAASMLNLARARGTTGDTADTERLLQEGLDLVGGLPPDDGSWPTPAIVRTRLLARLGLLLSETKAEDRAIPILGDAIAGFEDVNFRYPELPDLRSESAATRHNLARLLVERKDWAGARVQLEAAIVDQEFARKLRPDDPVALEYLGKHRRVHGIVLRELQDRAALPATAEALLALPLSADMARQAARSFLVAAQGAPADAAGHLHGRALAALLEAEKRGWGRNRLDDPIYTALEAVPGYVALKARVLAGQPPADAGGGR